MMKKLIYKAASVLRDRKGFTLIEMVTATALVAIFFTMAASVLPSWVTSYRHMVELSYARQISGSVFNAIEDQILFADEVRESVTVAGAIEGRNRNGSFVIPEKSADGTLLIEGLVYDREFYRGMKMKLVCTVENGKYCSVILTLLNEDGVKLVENTRIIKLAGKSA